MSRHEDEEPLRYYRTMEQIAEYRKKPVEEKLQWLWEQMKFCHEAMPPKAKEIREKLRKGEL